MNAIPDFSTVELGDSPAPNDLDAWADRVAAETGRGPELLVRRTPEQINVPALSTEADVAGLDTLD